MSEPVPTAETRVRFSDQLFSETVGIAAADDPPPAKDWGYEFSDGHRFDDAEGAYA